VRVVSLVPSATETLVELGVEPIACTRFCEQPGIATVGGTKDPRVGEIVALEPDLVVVNDEENRFEDAAGLLDAGLPVHSMSPRSVASVGPAVRALADVVEVAVPSPFGVAEWDAWLAAQPVPRPERACVLVWRRPWMSMAADTYGSSLLERLGLVSVLAVDPARYPEVSLEEIAAYAPAVVLLPSEPYPFKDRHASEVAAALPAARVRLVDGRDLFWWGVRTPTALDRLRATLGEQ